MNNLIVFIPALPLFGFFILFIVGRRLSKTAIAAVGTGTISAAAILVVWLGLQFLQSPPASGAYTQTLWQWIATDQFSCSFDFRIDAFSLVFVFVITFVILLFGEILPKFSSYTNISIRCGAVVIVQDILSTARE